MERACNREPVGTGMPTPYHCHRGYVYKLVASPRCRREVMRAFIFETCGTDAPDSHACAAGRAALRGPTGIIGAMPAPPRPSA